MATKQQADTFGDQSIKKALQSWHSLIKLGQHPLSQLKIVDLRRQEAGYGDSSRGYGLALRQVLRQAIDELKPKEPKPTIPPPPAKRWRPYFIIEQYYINEDGKEYIKSGLKIENVMFFKELNKGLNRLGDILWQWEQELVPALQRVWVGVPARSSYELVGRNELLAQLKQRLLTDKSLVLSAMNGLPGVGKSSLAIELVYDREVLNHFTGGILWAGLGRQPDVLTLLGLWGSALGISSPEMAQLTTLSERKQAIQRAIGYRKMLLVIDDAWRIEDALAFKIGCLDCACLLTTRQPSIAQHFAGADITTVSELSRDDGLALLKEFAPLAVEAEADAASELVEAVGALPLALVLMGQYLQGQESSQRRLRMALQQLRQVETRLRLALPASSLEQPSLAEEMPLSLEAVIGLSDEALNEYARQTLRALSVFPPKPNTFSEKAALALSGSSIQALDRLADAGLLESSRGEDRYTLHQAVASYASLTRCDNSPLKEMVSYFVNYVSEHEKDYDLLEQEINNLLAALDAADAQGMQSELLELTNTLYNFLEVRGLYTLAKSNLERAIQTARSCDDDIWLVASLLNLGRTEERFGNYTQAKSCYEEGLTLAKALGQDEKTSSLYYALGSLLRVQGEYKQAEAHFQEGLKLTRESGDDAKTCTLLNSLGTVEMNRGAYKQGEAYYQEGLALARTLQEPGLISFLLANLGAATTLRGAYEQASAYLQEGLILAKKLGHRERVIHLLVNLGEVERERGLYKQAERYFSESLMLAREIGNQWLTNAVLIERGELQLKQDSLESATMTFREALEIAEQIKAQNLVAKSWYGLAQIALSQGHIANARQLGQKSLAILEEIGHRNTNQVEEWLARLPFN